MAFPTTLPFSHSTLVATLRQMVALGNVTDAVEAARKALPHLGGAAQVALIETLLERPETQRDGLGALDTFVRSLSGRQERRSPLLSEITAPVAPPLWHLAAMAAPTQGGRKRDPQIEKTIKEWKELLGAAIIESLRWRHIRYSGAATGQTGTLSLLAVFDPETGCPVKVIEKGSKKEEIPGPKEAMVEIHFSLDTTRTYLEGRLPRTIAFGVRSDSPLGERRRVEVPPPPDMEASPQTGPKVTFGTKTSPPLRPEVMRILEDAIDGQRVAFPRPKITRRVVEGVQILELPARLHDENARYAREALSGIGTRGVTIMAPAGKPLPLPEIVISVAENGSFVGFVYAMPTGFSPRGTVYEIGTPVIGRPAKMEYARYRNPEGGESLIVPTNFIWHQPPTRLQRAAVAKWAAHPDFQTARGKWVREEIFF